MCSEVNGMNEAINYFVEGPPGAFFGPVCDYATAPVARQALFWNIPVKCESLNAVADLVKSCIGVTGIRFNENLTRLVDIQLELLDLGV